MSRFAVIAAACVLAIGCSSRSLAPEPLPVDKVECAHCGMIISSATGGGEIVSAGEATRYYDDIGCLAPDARSARGEHRVYVRVPGGDWLDARTAVYTHQANARTPMGSGVLAFRSASEATSAGRVLAWTDVLNPAGPTNESAQNAQRASR